LRRNTRNNAKVETEVTEEKGIENPYPEKPATPTRPAILSIEGIPGSRKSEILSILAEKYSDSASVIVLTEPVTDGSFIPEMNKDLMDNYLRDPEKYGLVFQVVYLLALSRQISQAIVSNLGQQIIICERSLLTARNIYYPLVKDYLPKIHQEVYESFFEGGGLGHVMPDEVIFLDSDVDKCHENTKINAGGEGFFTTEYLERCRLLHSQLLKEGERVVHVVDADPDDTVTTANQIMGIIQQVNGVEIEMLPEGPVYPDIISVDGNVGAGKSTLLNAIKWRLQLENRRDVVVVEEPVAEWTKITDGTKNILHCLYEAPDRYAFAFQTLVALTTMKANFVTAYEHPEARVILSERSLLSSRYVFAEALKDDGAMNDIEMKVYEALFKENVEWMHPKKNIYLKTSPESCIERIRKRDREEERGINIDWSRKYQGYYDRALYREEVDHPIIIEGDSTDVDVRGKWVDQVLSICDNILGIPVGYDKNEDAEDNREQDILHEVDEITPVRGDVKMSIKVRYRSRICRVGSSEDSLSQLREEVKRKWPRIMEENVGFTWKKVKGGPLLSITTEEELREALDIMSTQGRPVARLVITEGDNEGLHQGIDIPFDS